MTHPGSPSGTESPSGPGPDSPADGHLDGGEEHFKPVGTLFLLAIFVLALILLWTSVYVILISRGVTSL